MTYPSVPDGRAPQVPTFAGEMRKLRWQIAEIERKGTPASRPSGAWRLVTPFALTANTTVTLTNWGVVLQTPTGVSVNTATGVFSFDHVGWWMLSCSLRDSSASIKYLWFVDPVTGNQRYKTANDSNAFNIAAATPLWINSGQTLVVNTFANPGASVVQENPADDVPAFRAVYMGG